MRWHVCNKILSITTQHRGRQAHGSVCSMQGRQHRGIYCTAQTLPTPVTIPTLRILKCNDASRFLKNIDRLLTLLIHNNATRH